MKKGLFFTGLMMVLTNLLLDVYKWRYIETLTYPSFENLLKLIALNPFTIIGIILLIKSRDKK